jgi:hypothetical protein
VTLAGIVVDLVLVLACVAGIALCGPTRLWPNPSGPGWVLLASGHQDATSCWSSSTGAATSSGC